MHCVLTVMSVNPEIDFDICLYHRPPLLLTIKNTSASHVAALGKMFHMYFFFSKRAPKAQNHLHFTRFFSFGNPFQIL